MIEITEEELTEFLKDKNFTEDQMKFVFENRHVINSLPLSVLKKVFDMQKIRYLLKLFSV